MKSPVRISSISSRYRYHALVQMLLSFGFLILPSIIILNLLFPISLPHADAVLLSSHPLAVQSPQGPTMNDSHLKAEVVFKGIRFPTNMAFLGPNDILVLEKNEGTVRRIVNGTIDRKSTRLNSSH